MDDQLGEIKVEHFSMGNAEDVLSEAAGYIREMGNGVIHVENVIVHHDGWQSEWFADVYYREFTHPSK